jgi:hypothetical protein
MRTFPALAGPAAQVPSTPVSLWCWLRGDDAGDLLREGRAIAALLEPAFVLRDAVDAFRHGRGPQGFALDLSGYEDGIENPVRAAARQAALMQGQGPGLDGSSCASVQQWLHDFSALQAMTAGARDAMVGRRQADSEEIDDAPESAHVKRTAQESFSPPAFVLRRSMPWSAGLDAGLVFVAFGASPDAFEALMRRMLGLEDGITDALFRMSRPAHRMPCLVPADGRRGPGPAAPAGLRGAALAQRLRLYLHLIRWDRPAGWLLLLWPTLSALWIAAGGFPGWHLLLVFTLGTILMRSAGCCINDVADREFDRHVKRTAQRPVTSGAVSSAEALAVGAVLALAAFGLVLTTNAVTIVAWSVVALAIALAYPYAKRLVSMPQAVLGVAFSFGIPMAFCRGAGGGPVQPGGHGPGRAAAGLGAAAGQPVLGAGLRHRIRDGRPRRRPAHRHQDVRHHAGALGRAGHPAVLRPLPADLGPGAARPYARHRLGVAGPRRRGRCRRPGMAG